MNKHVILGAVKTVPRLLRTSSGRCFVSLRIADRTRYNGAENPVNVYEIIRYGDKKELESILNIKTGTAIYVSGTGLYNKRGFYNIIADEVHPLEKIDPETNTEAVNKSEDEYLSHLKAEYERQLEKDG